MAIAIANTSLAVGEIQREYLFGVKFLHLPNAMNSLFTGVDIFGAAGGTSETSDSGLFDCFCVQAQFPVRKQGKINFRYGGEYFVYAGVDESPKVIPFKFLISENSVIMGFLNAMKDLTGDLFNNRARPKAVVADSFTGDVFNYAETELAIGISMVSVDKAHGSKNMYRMLRNCSVYSVEGITADKGSQQSAPSLCTCEIGYDFIQPGMLDASGMEFGVGKNYTYDWSTPGSAQELQFSSEPYTD